MQDKESLPQAKLITVAISKGSPARKLNRFLDVKQTHTEIENVNIVLIKKST